MSSPIGLSGVKAVSRIVSSALAFTVGGAGSTGDYLGTSTTPQAFTSVGEPDNACSIIRGIKLIDSTTTAAVAMELWLFSATFVAPTDNAAWAITDAEALTCVGVIPLVTTKWYASSNNKVYSDDTLNLVVQPAASSLFYALVARGTTPDWGAAAGTLTIKLAIQ